MLIIFLGAALTGMLPAETADAQRRPIQRPLTSVYTELDLSRCRQASAPEEGASAEWLCPGHAGVPLIVLSGDGRFDIDGGEDNGLWESVAPFNDPGPRVEWRQRSGSRPHALIYRLRYTDARNRPRSALGVETISYPVVRNGPEGWSGCLVAWVGGDVPNANAVARRIADRMDRRFQCGHTEPEEIGIGAR